MQYEWDSLLETGNPKIDAQHKQLIATLNSLLTACYNKNSRAELERTIDFLLVYTVKHFADEEALQKEYDYPDYPRHKQLHEEFKVVAIGLAEQLQQDGYSEALTAEVHSHIGEWLVNHIKGDDLLMALYIKSKENNY